eukprot:jgi/Orpsp1_1/1181090/evm.model.c7180000075811.1
MRSLNSIKLLSLVCTSLLSLCYVKGIPVCTETETTETDDNGNVKCNITYNPSNDKYEYCYDSSNNKLKKIISSTKCLDTTDLIDSNTNIAKTGLYFLKHDGNLLSSDDNDSEYVDLINVTVDDQGNNKTYNEEVIKDGFYIQGGNANLIKCTSSSKKCEVFSNPKSGYYIDYKGGLIKNESGLSNVKSVAKGYYINGNYSKSNKALIKCDSSCVEVTAQNEDVYMDAAAESGTATIQCVTDTDNGSNVKCSSLPTSSGYYINSSAITSSSSPLIDCSSSTCIETTAPEPYSYYVNALNATKIISCSSTKNNCKLEQPAFGDHYVGINGDENTKLIECVSYDDENNLLECKEGSPLSGYYLNSGSNSSTNQTIYCDNSSCITKHVNPGYYKNNGVIDDDDVIIQCDLNTCTAKVSDEIDCSNMSSITSATVCYNDSGKFEFYKSDDLSAPLNQTSNGDLYVYENLKKFPSITNSDITTLYRISDYGVERYIGSGVIGVSTTSNQKVTDYSDATIGTDVVLYDCSSSTKLCTKRSSCVSNTYMYDIENKTALFCNSGKLEIVSSKGYYIDGVTMVGTKTPYIIKCDESKVCTHEAPSVTSYYVNSGYNSNSNALIYCSNSNCYAVTANSGYYVSNQQNGIISCTSSSSCSYKEATAAGNNANYVNAGADKGTYALIYCTKKTCVPKSARSGYYFTNRVTNLINCESSNSCSEITPTVNYYYYADTTD